MSEANTLREQLEQASAQLQDVTTTLRKVASENKEAFLPFGGGGGGQTMPAQGQAMGGQAMAAQGQPAGGQAGMAPGGAPPGGAASQGTPQGAMPGGQVDPNAPMGAAPMGGGGQPSPESQAMETILTALDELAQVNTAMAARVAQQEQEQANLKSQMDQLLKSLESPAPADGSVQNNQPAIAE